MNLPNDDMTHFIDFSWFILIFWPQSQILIIFFVCEALQDQYYILAKPVKWVVSSLKKLLGMNFQQCVSLFVTRKHQLTKFRFDPWPNRGYFSCEMNDWTVVWSSEDIFIWSLCMYSNHSCIFRNEIENMSNQRSLKNQVLRVFDLVLALRNKFRFSTTVDGGIGFQ